MYGGDCTNCSSHWNTGVETQILGYDWAIQCTGTAATCDHGVATATAPAIVGVGRPHRILRHLPGQHLRHERGAGQLRRDLTRCREAHGVLRHQRRRRLQLRHHLAGAAGAFQAAPAPNYPTGALDGSTWLPPIVSFATAPDCGTLILNGEAVNSSFLHQGLRPRVRAARQARPSPTSSSRAGTHRSWSTTATTSSHRATTTSTGPAPRSTTSRAAGPTASTTATRPQPTGTSAGAGTVTSCPDLTASLWIGHGLVRDGAVTAHAGQTGGLSVGAYSPGSYPACGSTSDYQAAGGGDATQVLGRGVYFQFESNGDNPVDGFVSTHEVSEVSLDAPPLGTSAALSGVPMLFAVESDFAAVHLDGPATRPRGNWTTPTGSSDDLDDPQGQHRGGILASAGWGGDEPGAGGHRHRLAPGNTAGGYRAGAVRADRRPTQSRTSAARATRWTSAAAGGRPCRWRPSTRTRRIDPYLLEQLYVAAAPAQRLRAGVRALQRLRRRWTASPPTSPSRGSRSTRHGRSGTMWRRSLHPTTTPATPTPPTRAPRGSRPPRSTRTASPPTAAGRPAAGTTRSVVTSSGDTRAPPRRPARCRSASTASSATSSPPFPTSRSR